MTSKEKVRELLTSQTEYVSGEEIAKSLGISRNAIWKAIEGLRGDGYVIDAATRRGYRMVGLPDRLEEKELKTLLDGEMIPMEFHEEIPSTNVRAKQLAVAGAEHGTIVIARQQSRGNGRKDHTFFSPEGGIYVSVILRSGELCPVNLEKPGEVMAYAASKVQKAILSITGRETEAIDNDIYLDGRKVCGILTEAGTEYESDYVQWVVIGVGLNVKEPEGGYPEDIKERAGALFSEGEAPEAPVMNRMAAELIRELLG